jgi:hypothetical protein
VSIAASVTGLDECPATRGRGRRVLGGACQRLVKGGWDEWAKYSK